MLQNKSSVQHVGSHSLPKPLLHTTLLHTLNMTMLCVPISCQRERECGHETLTGLLGYTSERWALSFSTVQFWKQRILWSVYFWLGALMTRTTGMSTPPPGSIPQKPCVSRSNRSMLTYLSVMTLCIDICIDRYIERECHWQAHTWICKTFPTRWLVSVLETDSFEQTLVDMSLLGKHTIPILYYRYTIAIL